MVSLLTELLQLVQVCLLELSLLFMTILISTLYLRCLTAPEKKQDHGLNVAFVHLQKCSRYQETLLEQIGQRFIKLLSPHEANYIG